MKLKVGEFDTKQQLHANTARLLNEILINVPLVH
jgi:hypothetical protein